MERLILTGNEAVALAAVHAGAYSSFAFPGDPATDIHLGFCRLKESEADSTTAIAPWSANEKAAIETALGLSCAGRRSLVSLNHVGLNVAMDPFMSSAVTGVNGGMLIVASHVEPNSEAPSFADEWKSKLADMTGREVLLVLEESKTLQTANPPAG